jgi:hypothetical protein
MAVLCTERHCVSTAIVRFSGDTGLNVCESVGDGERLDDTMDDPECDRLRDTLGVTLVDCERVDDGARVSRDGECVALHDEDAPGDIDRETDALIDCVSLWDGEGLFVIVGVKDPCDEVHEADVLRERTVVCDCVLDSTELEAERDVVCVLDTEGLLMGVFVRDLVFVVA